MHYPLDSDAILVPSGSWQRVKCRRHGPKSTQKTTLRQEDDNLTDNPFKCTLSISAVDLTALVCHCRDATAEKL